MRGRRSLYGPRRDKASPGCGCAGWRPTRVMPTHSQSRAVLLGRSRCLPKQNETARLLKLAADQGLLPRSTILVAVTKAAAVYRRTSPKLCGCRAGGATPCPGTKESQQLLFSGHWCREGPQRGCAGWRPIKERRRHNIISAYYYLGHGVPQDYTEAVRWFKLSADQGIDSSQVSLGQCYEKGRGVQQDMHEALRLYKRQRKEQCRGTE